MDTAVNKLLDVDKQARLILDEAQQYYDRTIADIETEKQRMSDEYEQKANRHLEDIRNDEQKSADDAAAGIKELYAKLTADMDAVFLDSHAEWETQLFNKCTGR